MGFQPDAVSARRTAQDWREAIRLVGDLYTRTGIASNEYTEAMIQGVEDYGPYIVLTPHVAMPHAKTTHGVNRGGAVVLTLETPVNFGMAANDPVDILISFAADDKKSHIKRIQELAAVLSDTELLEKIRNASNDEELARIFDDNSAE